MLWRHDNTVFRHKRHQQYFVLVQHIIPSSNYYPSRKLFIINVGTGVGELSFPVISLLKPSYYFAMFDNLVIIMVSSMSSMFGPGGAAVKKWHERCCAICFALYGWLVAKALEIRLWCQWPTLIDLCLKLKKLSSLDIFLSKSHNHLNVAQKPVRNTKCSVTLWVWCCKFRIAKQLGVWFSLNIVFAVLDFSVFPFLCHIFHEMPSILIVRIVPWRNEAIVTFDCKHVFYASFFSCFS